MGNDVSTNRSTYIERQMSNASGKDIETIQAFYNDFRNECPSGELMMMMMMMMMTMIMMLMTVLGKLSPQKFTELCNKVFGSSQAAELQEKAFR